VGLAIRSKNVLEAHNNVSRANRETDLATGQAGKILAPLDVQAQVHESGFSHSQTDCAAFRRAVAILVC